ncbi:hypothetical protein DFS34DRAFT_365075 [Phlyctochytrium arcticum]|nr:hypothetical protein DFS34DRAFT_365075 [Phlyctochytrium arcticum]
MGTNSIIPCYKMFQICQGLPQHQISPRRMLSKQNTITSGNKLDFSLLYNTPNLALKQDLITSTAKLPYSLISGSPDLSPYLTRTADLSSINATIATKVEKSVYDSRQNSLDTSIATKQNTITNILSLSGVDATSTNLLTDNFTIAPIGSLVGNATYDSTNKWVTLQVAGQTYSSGTLTYTIPNLGRYWTLQADLNYQSGNDEGFEISIAGWKVGFSSYYNHTKIWSPSGVNQTTIPPLSLTRNVWQTVKLNTASGTLISDVPVIIRGQSGGLTATKLLDNITVQDNFDYGSAMLFSSSTGLNGTLSEQLRIQSNGVFLAGGKLVASQEYVTTQIAAIPLSNYTLQTTIDNLLGTKVEKSVYDSRQNAIDTSLATKQPLISSSSKLDFSLISNGPDLAPFMNRTTDLNSINASIATKVSQSIYDIRQITIDTLIATKQSTITNSLQFAGVDATSTTLLTDNFTTTPTGTLSGSAVHDSTNKWVQTNSSGTLTYTIPNLGRYWTVNSSLNYGSQNDDGIQIMCEGTSPTVIPPLSLPRVTWANVVIKLFYDTLSVFVNGTLITSHQSSPLTGTVSGFQFFRNIQIRSFSYKSIIADYHSRRQQLWLVHAILCFNGIERNFI